MKKDKIKQVKELIASGICEPSRLYHILNTLEKEKSIYNSDQMYLDKMSQRLEEKMNHLQKENKKINYKLQNPQRLKLGVINNIDLDKFLDEAENRTLIDDADLDKVLERQEKKKQQRYDVKKQLPKQEIQNSVIMKIKNIFKKS